MSDSVWPHRRQPTRLPCPWDSPGKNTGVGCHFLLQCMKVKVKSHNRVWLLATPWTAAHQAPPSMGFSKQEYWSEVPLPSLEKVLCQQLWVFQSLRIGCLFIYISVSQLGLITFGNLETFWLSQPLGAVCVEGGSGLYSCRLVGREQRRCSAFYNA